MINQERYEEITKKALIKGEGDLDKGLCIMQAVAYITGEGITDHPECASPVITDYAIRLNDSLKDEDRQKLKDIIPLIVGTKTNKEDDVKRARLIVFRTITVIMPILTDSLKLFNISKTLREFKNDIDSFILAAQFLRDKKLEIRNAAYADAYAAAAHAAAAAYAAAHAASDAAYAAYADAVSAAAYADAYAAAHAAHAAAHAAYADAVSAAAYADADADADAAAINQERIETLRLVCNVKG